MYYIFITYVLCIYYVRITHAYISMACLTIKYTTDFMCIFISADIPGRCDVDDMIVMFID